VNVFFPRAFRGLSGVLWVLGLLVAAASPAGAAPSCAEGPQTTGSEIVGTPCADTIRLPRSVTAVRGEGGDDTLYGQRGNDRLFGGEGADRLYGGIGDDRLRGGPGDDRLSGGFGADSLDGETGGDLARGDATIDFIGDTGGGTDTLSFATGATPGFPNQSAFFTAAGFPPTAVGRGVYLDIGGGFANNGLAPSGGGVDEPFEAATFGDFEVVIGTAFADRIVGTADTEIFFGGGGADLIEGGGGADIAYGGAEGDGCLVPVANECESSSAEVEPRDPGTISAGQMASQATSGPALYLSGSDGDDSVVATYAGGQVTFTATGVPVGSFVVPEAPDSILLAGHEGDDSLSAGGFPDSTSVVVLGGEEADALAGGDTEDALIDGAGNDAVLAGGRDDAVPNNGGSDTLDAGPGEDLFISNAVCDGDSLQGGADRDNANWANFGAGVAIDQADLRAGLVGEDGEPDCDGGALTVLGGIEDTEGSSLGDVMTGDTGPNQLLGRLGGDIYRSGEGNDSILANSGTPRPDPDLLIDCGPGFDTAQIDQPANGPDPSPFGCEIVEERAPNSFRPPDTPPDPDPEPEPEAPATVAPVAAPQPQPPLARPQRSTTLSAEDRIAPQTRIVNRPGKLLFSALRRPRRVAVHFRATEPGAAFSCRVDRRRWARCASPRRLRLGPGRHVFRVAAIDAAGNKDASPARFAFRVVPRR
jgi:Ca2+-binding RTX toxin-like protein